MLVFFAGLGFPLVSVSPFELFYSCVGECLWVINVEAHAAHCRMPNAKNSTGKPEVGAEGSRTLVHGFPFGFRFPHFFSFQGNVYE